MRKRHTVVVVVVPEAPRVRCEWMSQRVLNFFSVPYSIVHHTLRSPRSTSRPFPPICAPSPPAHWCPLASTPPTSPAHTCPFAVAPFCSPTPPIRPLRYSTVDKPNGSYDLPTTTPSCPFHPQAHLLRVVDDPEPLKARRGGSGQPTYPLPTHHSLGRPRTDSRTTTANAITRRHQRHDDVFV